MAGASIHPVRSMAAEDEYIYRDSYRDDDIISEDNISYMSMNGISPRSSTYSSSRASSCCSPWPAQITSPGTGSAQRCYQSPAVVLPDLSEFHYGIINVELAENLCTEFGEFLLRSGRSSCIDIRLTVRLRNGHHGHFTIYKEDHPFSGSHSIYFLDDKTRQFAFIGVSELLQYIVHMQYLPGHTSNTSGKIPLHPCLKSSKMVVNSIDVTLGRVINPNPASSKTFYMGFFKSIKAVLVKKKDNVKVITEAGVRSQFHVGHPNIVPMLGVSVIEPICLILHEEAQHSLYDYIKKLKSSKRNRMISICHDICCGMIYLHSNNCLIRSLLTRACSINLQSGTAMISDFDKSCFIDGESIEPGEGETVLVPTRWAAPEVLKNSRFSKSSDVWSFGVFVWEVFNNAKVPYRDLRNEQLLEKLKPGFRLSLTKKQLPYDVILEKCLRYNESNRPSFNFIEGVIQSLL